MNNEDEINSFTIQALSKMKKLIKGYMDFPTWLFSFKKFLHYFKGQFGNSNFKQLTDKNKKSVVGRVYTTWKSWKNDYMVDSNALEKIQNIDFSEKYKSYLDDVSDEDTVNTWYGGDKDKMLFDYLTDGQYERLTEPEQLKIRGELPTGSFAHPLGFLLNCCKIRHFIQQQ